MASCIGRLTRSEPPMINLPARYAMLMTGDDPCRHEVARRQLARLTRAPKPSALRPGTTRSRWAHVPLTEIFTEAGNMIHTRAERAETGHEPLHHSRSGRCVLLDLNTSRWWCRGCHQHGDAASFVMAWRGWS